MPEVKLFSSKSSPGYFAAQRFDRNKTKRYHLHSACGLLHSDCRAPSLAYEDLLTLTEALTKDMREVEKMFSRAVFNVLSHNREDHAKNFNFLMDEKGAWKLSLAYDLIFSSGPNGEQRPLVAGEGKCLTIEHLFKLGEAAKIALISVQNIITQQVARGRSAMWCEIC